MPAVTRKAPCCLRLTLQGPKDKAIDIADVAKADRIMIKQAKVPRKALSVTLSPDSKLLELVVCGPTPQTEPENLFEPQRLRKRRIVPLNDLPSLFKTRLKTVTRVSGDWMCRCP